MELIQPTRRGQFIEQAPIGKLAPGKRLLLVDPYPRNNPYRLTASERARGVVSQAELTGDRGLYAGELGSKSGR